MTAFYLWIMTALPATMRELEEKGQNVKLTMYKRLHNALVISIGILFVYMLVHTINFWAYSHFVTWYISSWRLKWFLSDGWLNLLYISVFSFIAWLWRPTEHNERYGLEELSQNDKDEENGNYFNVRRTISDQISLQNLGTPRRSGDKSRRNAQEDELQKDFYYSAGDPMADVEDAVETHVVGSPYDASKGRGLSVAHGRDASYFKAVSPVFAVGDDFGASPVYDSFGFSVTNPDDEPSNKR